MAQTNLFRRIFGFAFNGDVTPNLPTPVAPSSLDSSIDITTNIGGGISPYVSSINIDGIAKNENDLIDQYRVLSKTPEVDRAIDEICSEAIITDKKRAIVTIDLDEVILPDKIKEIMVSEHDAILNLYGFTNNGYEMFRRWYIDGRINYQILIDSSAPNNGIQELRYVDPKKIKRVRELIKGLDQLSQVEIIQGVKEYFIYKDGGVNSVNDTASALVMTRESIIHCNSGIHDPSTNTVTSYLQPAIRPANNLQMMEDAMVLYRLARAPERRVFKIFTGDLPKAKADQYVQEIANKYRNKISYDHTSGKITTDKRYMAMTEDYWLPVGDGSKGVGIDTLPGGENLGETGEPEYFKNKLYESLRVPSSRMSEQAPMFSSGTEITRDEVRFSRFINRLRNRFSGIFIEALKRQCVLKGIMSEQEFSAIENSIMYRYAEDNYFSEAVEYNIINQRMAALQMVDPFVGKYISQDYVYKNILMMSEEEQNDEMQKVVIDSQRMVAMEIQEQQARISAGIANPPVAESNIQPPTAASIIADITPSKEQLELDAAATSILEHLSVSIK